MPRPYILQSSTHRVFSYSARLFCNVYAHRAPGDAAPATHAARSAKLVLPGGELMRHPLAVARLGARPRAPTMHVRKVHREARVPFAPPLGALARQVGHVLNRSAETCGADHRAVAACQAA